MLPGSRVICLDASGTSGQLLPSGWYTIKELVKDELFNTNLVELVEQPGRTYSITRFKELESALSGKDPLNQPNCNDVGLRKPDKSLGGSAGNTDS